LERKTVDLAHDPITTIDRPDLSVRASALLLLELNPGYYWRPYQVFHCCKHLKKKTTMNSMLSVMRRGLEIGADKDKRGCWLYYHQPFLAPWKDHTVQIWVRVNQFLKSQPDRAFTVNEIAEAIEARKASLTCVLKCMRERTEFGDSYKTGVQKGARIGYKRSKTTLGWVYHHYGSGKTYEVNNSKYKYAGVHKPTAFEDAMEALAML
jgi:hypothetical protein